MLSAFARSRALRLVLTSALALVALAGTASASTTREQAAAAALRAARVTTTTAPVVVLAEQRPVPAGARITASSTPVSLRAVEAGQGRAKPVFTAIHDAHVATLLTAAEPSWLFYVDFAPDTQHAHAARVFLVGVASGGVRMTPVLSSAPLVNGVAPSFLRSTAAYAAPAARVFERVRTASSAPRLQPATPTSGPVAAEFAHQLGAQGTCVVLFGETFGTNGAVAGVDRSVRAVATFYSRLAASDPRLVVVRFSAASRLSPTAYLAKVVRDHACRNVVVYAAGAAQATGDPAVLLGSASFGRSIRLQELAARRVRDIVLQYPRTQFSLVVDAPHAGRFRALLGDVPNLAAFLAPDGGNQSFAFVPRVRVGAQVVRNTGNPEQLLEFTNDLLRGLSSFATSPDEVQAAGEQAALTAADGGSSTATQSLGRGARLGNSFVGHAAGVEAPVVEEEVPTSAPAPNRAPVASAAAVTGPEDGSATVTLAGTDADGDALTADVATNPAHGALVGAGSQRTYTPLADFSGSDSFTFTVTDSNGVTSAPATVTIAVTPVNDAPLLDAAPASVAYTEGDGARAVAVDATVSDVDSPELAGASVTVSSGYVAGEDLLGVTTQGGITGSFDAFTGRLTLTGSASPAAYRAALRAVTYANSSSNPSTAPRTLTFSVSDGALTATDTTSIGVTGVQNASQVVASAGATAYTEQAAAVQVDAALTVADADDAALTSATARVASGFVAGDQLSFTAGNGITGVYTSGTGVLALSGTSSVANYETALRSVRFASTSDDPSTARTIGFTANDGHSNSAEASKSIAVTVVDDAPVAVADAASVTEDANAAAVAVLANDTDVDAGPKSVASVTQPANGTVVITGGGTGLTYAPHADYCGADSFTYTLAPGTSTQTVSITVTCVDDAPVAVNDSVTVLEDAAATAVDVLANDTDVDNGAKSITSATQPTFGIVVITGGGTGLTFQPTADRCGADSFTYTLSPGGSTATVTANVTCVDDVPVAVADAATVIEDSGASAIDVLANDTDIDTGSKQVASITQPASGTVVITGAGTGLTYAPNSNSCNTPPGTTPDAFTYTLSPGTSTTTVSVSVTCVDDNPNAVADSTTVIEDSGANAVAVLANDADVDGGPKSINSVTQPANGTVVITGGGTGLTYAPNANYCNAPPGTTPDTFTYTLTPGGSTTTVTVTVTCVDDAPVAVADFATVAEDSGITGIAVLANDTDIDGGAKSVASVTQPASGTVVITGGGTGVSFTPAANVCGLQAFTYTLAPGTSSATVTVTVTCVNDAPTALALATSTVTENQVAPTVVGALSTTDADSGDSFTYTVVGGADAASFGVSGSNLRLLAPADYETKSSYSVQVRSTDSGSAFVDNTFTVTVANANDAPTAIALSNNTVRYNQAAGAVVGVLSATDQDAGDTRTFTLVTGAGDTDNGSFQIVGTSLQTSAVLTGGARTVRIRVTDTAGAAFEQAFTITVTVNQAPTDVALSASTVAENAAANTTVGTLSTTDADAGDTFAYSLVAGTGSTDNASFNLSGSTLRTSSALDYEAGATRSVRVRTTDAAGDFIEKVFTITITNVQESPTDIALTPGSVNENAGVNAVVGVLSSTDPEGGAFGYALVVGSGSTDNASFNVSGSNLRANGSFDFEVKSSYTVRLQTTDSTGGTFQKAFTITVNDVNEAPVVAADAFNGAANKAVGNTTLIVDDPTDGALTVSTPAKTISGDVLGNDSDPDAGQTATLAVTAMTATSGSITTFQADGDFVYQPPTGCAAASDTVTYTVSDGTLSTNGTITVGLVDCVWYVDAAAAAGGTGSSVAPLQTLTPLNNAGADLDAPSQQVFLYAGTYTTGLALEDGQRLSSQRHGLAVNDGAATQLLPRTPADPSTTITGGLVVANGVTIQGIDAGTNAAGYSLSGTTSSGLVMDTVTSGSIANPLGGAVSVTALGGALNVVLTTLSSAGSTGYGVYLDTTSGVSGSFAAGGGAISNAATTDVLLSGGTFDFTYDGTITDNNGTVFGSSQRAGGTNDFNGAITATGGNMYFFDSAAVTSRFDGAVNISGPNMSVNASGAGNIVFTAPSSITSPGIAVSIRNGASLTATGLTISSSGSTALEISNAAAIDVDPTSSITSTGGGRGVSLYYGTGTVNVAAPITTDFGYPVEVYSRTGGAATFSGRISDTSTSAGIYVHESTGGSTTFSGANSELDTATGAAVQLVNNAGHATSFTGGGLDLDTTSGTGVSATGGGTLNITGSGNTVDTTNGVAVATNGMALNTSFATVSSANSAGSGIAIVGGSGTFVANSGAITNASGADVALSGAGTTAFTYGGSITDDLGQLVSVSGQTAGTKLFSGAITDGNDGDGSGISLTSNAGATVSFTGGVVLSTGSNAAFAATGGGTVTVTGAANTLTTTTGTALNVASTTIGATGLTFRSISANGAPNGILLNATGTSGGGLTVTGDGASARNGSGGTIQSTVGADGHASSGVGVYLNDTDNVTLDRMVIQNHPNWAIHGFDVNNFTMRWTSVTGANGTNDIQDEGAVYFGRFNASGLRGTATITNDVIEGGYEDNLNLSSNFGTLNVTITNDTIGLNSTSFGNDGVFIEPYGAGVAANAVINANTFLGARGDMLDFLTSNGASGNVDLTNNVMHNTHPNIVSAGGGISVRAGNLSSGTYLVSGNSLRGAVGSAINVAKGTGNGTFAGRIQNNTIGNPVAAGSGSSSASGIALRYSGGGANTSLIANNTIHEVSETGIFVASDTTNAGMSSNVTLDSNTITPLAGFPVAAIYLQIGTGNGDSGTFCYNVLNNSATGAGGAFAVADLYASRLDPLIVSRLPGYAGTQYDYAAVEAYLQGRNTGGPSVSVDSSAPASGSGFTDTPGSAPCVLPV